MNIKDLIGKPLEDFTIQEYTEVYMTDDDGRKRKTIGFFKNNDIAAAWGKCQTDQFSYKTDKVYVLTNNTIGFLTGEAINILDDEKAALEIKEKALAKLEPEEKKILGL